MLGIKTRTADAFSLIELMVIITIIGVLAAVAIPSYQTYVIKARIVEVITLMGSYKTTLVNGYNTTGGFTNFAAGPTSKYVTNMTSGNKNSQNVWIQAQISSSVGVPDTNQQFIIMLVRVNNDIINTYCGQWNSGGTYIDTKYLPSSCQGTNIYTLEY